MNELIVGNYYKTMSNIFLILGKIETARYGLCTIAEANFQVVVVTSWNQNCWYPSTKEEYIEFHDIKK